MPDADDASDDPVSALALLASLRHEVTTGDAEFTVTLVVSGAWISGTLTSLRRYVDAVTAQFQAAEGQMAAPFADGWANEVEPMIASLLNEPSIDPQAIYLRETDVCLPGGQVVSFGPTAIRADSIDAVFLGEMRIAGRES